MSFIESVQPRVAEHQLTDLARRQRAEIDAVQISVCLRDWIAAGDQQFAAVRGTNEEREDFGGDRVPKFASGWGQQVFEIIEHQEDFVMHQSVLQGLQSQQLV